MRHSMPAPGPSSLRSCCMSSPTRGSASCGPPLPTESSTVRDAAPGVGAAAAPPAALAGPGSSAAAAAQAGCPADSGWVTRDGSRLMGTGTRAWGAICACAPAAIWGSNTTGKAGAPHSSCAACSTSGVPAALGCVAATCSCAEPPARLPSCQAAVWASPSASWLAPQRSGLPARQRAPRLRLRLRLRCWSVLRQRPLLPPRLGLQLLLRLGPSQWRLGGLLLRSPCGLLPSRSPCLLLVSGRPSSSPAGGRATSCHRFPPGELASILPKVEGPWRPFLVV